MKRTPPKSVPIADAPSETTARPTSGKGFRLTSEPDGLFTISITLDPAWPRQAIRRVQHLDFCRLAVLVLPLLILSFDASALFSIAGWLDAWIYHGFFTHLVEFKSTLFPNTYYGSRMSWILPGYVANYLFAPVTANYVLHLAVYYTGALSLYYIIKCFYNSYTALLACLAFTCYPHVWSAIGTDYVDGPGLAYYLLALAFMTGAIRTDRPRVPLTAAGAAFAATVYTNLTWLPFAPLLIAYYLYLRRPQTLSAFGHRLLESARWLAVGSLAITAVLCFANYAIDGRFWFYAPSVEWAMGNGGKPNPSKAASYEWVGRAHWLLYIGIALATTVLYGIRRLLVRNEKANRATDFFQLHFLYCLGLWIAIELKGWPLLELPYYASYLIPAMFLALTPVLFFVVSKAATRYLIPLGAAVILFAPWSPALIPLLKIVPVIGISGLLVFGIACIVARVMLPGNRATLVAGLVGFSAINFYLLGPVALLDRLNKPRGGEDAFIRMTKTVQDIDRARHGRKVQFWYNLHDPNVAEFDSINSFFLWGYTWIGREFPAITVPANELVKAPGVIAVLSTSDDTATLMRQADDALRVRGLVPALRARNRIDYRGVHYAATLLELTPDLTKSSPLAVRFETDKGAGIIEPPTGGLQAASFPVDRWALREFPGGGGEVRPGGDGVYVRTPGLHNAYGAIYGPLAPAVEGKYRFVLRYLNRSGHMTFGIIQADNWQWLLQAGAPSIDGAIYTKECTVSLRAGQRVWVLTTNARLPGDDHESEFMIVDLRAYKEDNSVDSPKQAPK